MGYKTSTTTLLHLPLMHLTMSILAHVYSYTLDHVEPELEESMEQARAEDPSNLALDQAKP
jgi:hypothetical protein